MKSQHYPTYTLFPSSTTVWTTFPRISPDYTPTSNSSPWKETPATNPFSRVVLPKSNPAQPHPHEAISADYPPSPVSATQNPHQISNAHALARSAQFPPPHARHAKSRPTTHENHSSNNSRLRSRRLLRFPHLRLVGRRGRN